MNIKTFVFNAFALAALFSLPSLAHASITPSLSPSRTTGVAPLSVFFDASGTTASTTTLPFHELDYSWNFGDDDTATWTYGARPGVNKKNRAFGPEAAHIFEPTSFPDDCTGTPCKIFTVTLTVYDGTDTTTTTQTISVTDPDTVFSGANTVCFSTSGTFTDCPSGASTVTTSSFDSAITNNIGSNKRLLFKKGDTFFSTNEINLNSAFTTAHVGSYGVGTNPIFDNGSKTSHVFDLNNANIDDFRITDMTINNGSGTGAFIIGSTGYTYRNVLVSKVSSDGMKRGIISSGSGSWANLMVYDSVIQNINNYGIFLGYANNLAILGSKIDGVILDSSYHTLRLSLAHNGVISNSEFGTSQPGGLGDIKIHAASAVSITGDMTSGSPIITNVSGVLDADGSLFQSGAIVSGAGISGSSNISSVSTGPNTIIMTQDATATGTNIPITVGAWGGQYTENIIVSQNKIIGNNSWAVNYAPQSARYDERLRNIIHEGNYQVVNGAQTIAINLRAMDSSVRNNIIDMTGATAFTGVNVQKLGIEPGPNNNYIHNNTIYAGLDHTVTGISIGSTTQNTYVKNNLGYAPGTGTKNMALDAGVDTLLLNNSSDLELKNINPFPTATPTSLSDFIPTTGSYALASGTTVPVYRDFYGNLRGATMDMGAFKQDSDPNDTTPPILSSITANVTSDTTATITWTTNELSDSTVNYGTTDAYGQTSTSASNVTSHTRSLTGLTPGTIYHFEVLSTDPSTNTTTSADQTFTTTGINAVIAPSRTTGVAPLSVFFDASGTTASTTTLPFHELDYSWNFGDDDTATWAYGSNPSVNKKNRAFGPEAAHVFETPGTYTVTLSVYDGTETSTTQQLITVTDPDTVFSGTNTICFANNTTYTGCPAGATQTGNTSALSLAACTAGKRCLFKRGDTYTTNAQTFSVAGAVTIGAYGSGVQPIFSRTSEAVTAINIASTAVNDLRIMDVEITGASTSPSDSGACITVSAMPTNITMLRLVCHDIGKGIINTGSNGMTGSIIQDSQIYNIGATSGGVGIYGKFIQSAILGNSVGPFNTTAEHNVRIQPGRQVVVSHNTITTPGNTGKAVLTIRAADHLTGLDLDPVNDTQYVYISDNKLMGGTSSVQMFQIAPASNSQNDWIYDVIAERNWIVFGSVAQQGLFTEGTRLTARNNICDATGGANGRTCFNNDHRNIAGVPVPDDNRFYNNTCYSGDVSGNLQCVTLGAFGSQTITNSVVKNNLGYAPDATVARLLYLATPSDGITGTIGASGTFGNSSDIQVADTNPFPTATPTILSDFIPTTGSYAIASGTSVPVYRDFYNNLRGATPDMGAFNLDSTPEDTTPPTLTESSVIATGTDTTPDYTFSTTEAGSLTYGGDCTSSTTTATSGSNTITFTTLSVGTHSNCTITATDSSNNPSTPLAVTSFTITAPTVTASSSSSSSHKKKKKKKKISSKITYKQGERTAPYITLLTPKKGSLITKSFPVKAGASDKSGIQAMFVSINGTKKKRVNNTGSILYTSKKLKNATVSVSAYDTLGNVKVAQITVTDGKVTGVRYY